jgi:hypothetical protein
MNTVEKGTCTRTRCNAETANITRLTLPFLIRFIFGQVVNVLQTLIFAITKYCFTPEPSQRHSTMALQMENQSEQ